MIPRKFRQDFFLTIQSSTLPGESKYKELTEKVKNTATHPGKEKSEITSITVEEIFRAAKNLHFNPVRLTFIGEGKFNKVYSFQNKIIKFTISQDDVKTLQLMQKLASQVSYPQHLLKVFNIMQDPETKIYVCVVEKLEPISPTIKALLLPFKDLEYLDNFSKSTNKFRFKKMIESETLFLKIFKNAIIKTIAHFQSRIKQEDEEKFEKIIYDIHQIDRKYLFDLFQQQLAAHRISLETDAYLILSFFINILRDFVSQNTLSQEVLELLAHYTMHDIQELSHKIMFPRDRPTHLDKEIFFLDQLETKTFIQTLLELSKLGFHWSDLHTANIMMRPGTRELVISDPGMFDIA